MEKERMDAFVEEVRQKTDILQVVQTYVPLKRKSGRYWGCCPFHQEKTPSFSVVPEKGFFYCFGCHTGGNAFKFLSLIENISYFDAVKLQAEKLGIPMPSRPLTEAEEKSARERKDLRKVNKMARDFFHNCLTLTKMGAPGRNYFKKRGITEKTIEDFSLGFAPPSWDKLSRAFLGRGIAENLLTGSGLCARRKNGNGLYDRFRSRVIIPIADERGHIVGFGGRVLDDSQPKYLNTPETVLFNKRRLLFGLDRSHRAIDRADFAIIVEGYMDAISVFGAGVENVVATLGTAFTMDHAKKLLRYASRLVFCYDSDEAGQKATVRALAILQNTGAEVRVLKVPDGKDPDEFIRKNGAEAFRALAEKAQPLVDYRLSYVLSHTRIESLEGKVQAIRQMAPVLGPLREGAARTEHVRRLAAALMIDEGVVRDELRRAGSAQEASAPERAPIRHVVRGSDSALAKAGRVIIRRVATERDALGGAEGLEAFAGILPTTQAEVLRAMQTGAPMDEIQASLSDDAAAELSRALIDDSVLGARSLASAFDDALALLQKTYLEREYQRHSRLAEKYLEAGNPDYRVELQQTDKIKSQLEEMESIRHGQT